MSEPNIQNWEQDWTVPFTCPETITDLWVANDGLYAIGASGKVYPVPVPDEGDASAPAKRQV